ncbi:hypothetical protein [Streptomyces pratensis]|uniref:hypothetical protein n=1 Tax=Streptomyces pratensis TaxID=1169025 RepID=UPI003016DFA3
MPGATRAAGRRWPLPVFALLTTAAAWTRAGVYAATREDVVEAVAGASRVTEESRDAVLRIQDGLQYVWVGFPVLLTLLAFVAALVKVGQLALIGISGVVGTLLAVAGMMLPSTGVLVFLAGAFLAGVCATVAAAVLPGRAP